MIFSAWGAGEGCRLIEWHEATRRRQFSRRKEDENDKRWERTNLPGLDRGPLVPLDVERDEPEGRENSDGLESHLVSRVKLGLRAPGKEGGDVLGHLRGRSGRSVVVLDETVEENSGHTDGLSGEVGVVVHALGNVNTGGGVNVSGKKRENVVLDRREETRKVSVVADAWTRSDEGDVRRCRVGP